MLRSLFSRPLFLRLNLLLLLVVAFLPFPTRLLAANIDVPDAERVATCFAASESTLVAWLRISTSIPSKTLDSNITVFAFGGIISSPGVPNT